MLTLPRAPRTDDELWWAINALFGIKLPRVAVCDGHVSPFDAVAHAFFGREPNFAVWYASRGSGKSLALAVLGLIKAFVYDVDVTILGGSMTQSLNVREHMRTLMRNENAPQYAVDKDQATLIQMQTGKTIKPLPASQTTVRGPHPALSLLDECLSGATIINTSSGPKRIDSISVGDTVWSWTHAGLVERTVLAARCTGIKQTLRIRLADGRELVITGNHPVLTNHGWVSADACQADTQVRTVQQMADWPWQANHADVSGLLATGSARPQDEVHLQGLRQPVLRDWGQRTGKVQSLCSEGQSGQGHQLSGLWQTNNTAFSTLSPVLAELSVKHWDDKANGSGPGYSTQDKGADQQGRDSDDGVAGSSIRAIPTLSSHRTMDRGLRATRSQGSDRGSRSILARQRVGCGEGRKETSQTGRAWFSGALSQNGSDASLVAVASVEPGPEIPVYNLTVAGEHNYLANGVVVHNCDEMEPDIYNAALGQAMEQINNQGQVVNEYIVASSTWQWPEGTFTQIIEDARTRGLPVFSWCYKELMEPHGWMTKRFIDGKRAVVSAQMWSTEYDLNEPSAGSRAFDLDKVEQYFIDYPPTIWELHQGNGDHDVYLWEKPVANGLYAVGADWAKEHDKTVIAVIRYDIEPHRIVKLTRVNRRPWDVMIKMFNDDTQDYQAVAEHDGTGLGNVVNDFVDFSDTTNKFVMIGRPRTQMLLDYITDFEHGKYRMPRIPANLEFPGVVVNPLYRAHRAVTVADVYAPGKWNTHLPDDIAAIALAHRAVKKLPAPTRHDGSVKQEDYVRGSDKQFYVKPEGNMTVNQDGVVTVVDERYELDSQWLVVDTGSRDEWAANI